MTVRICKTCHQEKALTDFPRHKTGVGGHLRHCKDCNRKSNRALVDAKPEQYAASHWRKKMLRTYGLTEAQYDAMLIAQQGVCAICFQPETIIDPQKGKLRRLAVDHHHVSKRVRGLLCYRCNTSIGRFEESITLLHSAIAYLTRFKDVGSTE